jgi:hypothetical protein
MKPWLQRCWRGTRFCGQCALTLACWTLWLALAVLLAVQVGIATSHELAVPGFLLQDLEHRLAAARIQVHFGRTTFDPSGRLLIENLRLSLPEFDEPVVTGRAVLVDLDPWALLAGQFSPRRLHATGVDLYVPAMLAASGKHEAAVSQLDFTLRPDDGQIAVDHLTAHVAGVALDARGAFRLPPRTGRVAPLPLADYLAQHYPAICRQLTRGAAELAAFEQPQVQIRLEPAETPGAIAFVTVDAARLNLTAPQAVKAAKIRVTARIPLSGGAAASVPLTVTADRLDLPGEVMLRSVQGEMRGTLALSPFSFQPRAATLQAREIAARGFVLQTPAARLRAGPLNLWSVELVADYAGSLVGVSGEVDPAAQAAKLRFDGALDPSLLDPIGRLIGRDVRRFVDFGAPVKLAADIVIDAGWKFRRLAGQVAAQQIMAHRVPIDSAHGEIEFDGRHFIARHAVARLGENIARGSFEQDLVTRGFRFLLDGRLRPLEIEGWFHDWWPRFFANFSFPLAPPDASVDVSGRWFDVPSVSVFVYAHTSHPVVRGATFDFARALLFIRPNFIDGLELFGTRGAGDIRGTFTRREDLDAHDWLSLDFDLTSSLDLDAGRRLLGPTLSDRLDPFAFQNAPRLKVSGHLDGPAALHGEHQTLRIVGESDGRFSLFDFPAQNVAFDAQVRDNEIAVDRVSAQFADGTLTGKARIWGEGDNRRLGFDASLRNATLDTAVATVQAYADRLEKSPAPRAASPLPSKNRVNLDLALSAEGRYDDLYSFHGSGNALLEGPGLGEVRLLGLLSDLINFTALRFTSARTDFKLEGRKLVFPSVNITGANSAIQAHGDYTLDRHRLDFNARVYPFQESKSIFQNVMGAVLSPLSAVLEVKLTGPLDAPEWSFVVGPTNFLRALSQPAPSPGPREPPSYIKR